jgi:hypothetical protein
MKASDLLNVLSHLPGCTDVDDALITLPTGEVIRASDVLHNLTQGLPLFVGAQADETQA